MADSRVFLVDALEPQTLLRLKGSLLNIANLQAVSSNPDAANSKVGVFSIARSLESNEVQLKVGHPSPPSAAGHGTRRPSCARGPYQAVVNCGRRF
jgi:hypothetical protein